MEYRVFQYGVDARYVKAILVGSAVEMHSVVRTEEWFCQRFEQNPLGKAVLTCAFDGDRMVSCVAVERFHIQCEGKTLVGGCMHVLFCQEGYDIQNMWVGLIKAIEEECKLQGIVIVFSFKGSDLIALNEEYGWKYDERYVRYQFNSVTGMWRSIFKLMDLGKPFIADVKRKQSDGVQKEMTDNAGVPDYYKWLICISPKRFLVVDNEEVCSVILLGQRGKRVIEAQICYFEPKKSVKAAQRSLVEFVKGQFAKGMVDVVSCIDGKNYLSKRNSLRTSQEVNYCYKYLGEPIDFQIGEMTQLEMLLP